MSLYPPQTKFEKGGGGLYRNHPVRPSVSPVRLSVRPSVRPSMYLVSATPPKRLIGFLCIYLTPSQRVYREYNSTLPADMHEGIWLLSKI